MNMALRYLLSQGASQYDTLGDIERLIEKFRKRYHVKKL